MAINPATPVYGTNNPEDILAVVDVDISAPNDNRPQKVSAKAQVVKIAGNIDDTAPLKVLPTTGAGGVGVSFAGGQVALTGASQIVVAAGAGKNFVVIQNLLGNNPVTLNLSGAAAVANQGIVLQANGSITLEKGAALAITAIGTAAQNIIVFAG